MQVFVANQGHFFKENIAVPHIRYMPQPSPGARTAPARAPNCIAGHTSRSAAMSKPEHHRLRPSPALCQLSACKAPSSFPDLLLGEVTGELHLLATIPQAQTRSSIAEPHTPISWTHSLGDTGFREEQTAFLPLLKSGNKAVGMEINLCRNYMQYCPWDGENSVFARDVCFIQGNTVISHQRETRRKKHWESFWRYG